MAKTAKPAAPEVTPQAPAAPEAAPAVTRDEAVGKLINEAGQAASSMLAKVKEAAALAAKQLDANLPVRKRLDNVVLAYAADFTAAGHNIRALFVDALTLHAAAQTPVTVRAMGKDGKMADQNVTAQEAAAMPKHAMRDAAKQVREALGIARKAGGGRKASAKKPAAPVNNPDGAEVQSEVDAFSAWLDNLIPYVQDQVFHAKIQARLIENGFTLGKAAKGKQHIAQ